MQPYDPSEDEIRLACEQIRAGWSAAETRRRSAWCDPERWEAPVVEFDDELVTGT